MKSFPAEVITVTDKEGKMKPIKFRLIDENGETKVFKVEGIVQSDLIAPFIDPSNKHMKYIFRVLINDAARDVELLYYFESMKWKLRV